MVSVCVLRRTTVQYTLCFTWLSFMGNWLTMFCNSREMDSVQSKNSEFLKWHRYHHVSWMKFLVIYRLLQNRRIVILSLSWAKYCIARYLVLPSPTSEMQVARKYATLTSQKNLKVICQVAGKILTFTSHLAGGQKSWSPAQTHKHNVKVVPTVTRESNTIGQI